MSSSSLDLSVIIITYNEEMNLSRCLESLPRGSQIVVVDSSSEDKTCEIAKQFGAEILQRPFVNFQDQKNFALAQAKHAWVLSLDADEQLSDALRDEIAAITQAPDAACGYRLPRQLVFMGKALRYGKTKDYPLRLFRRQGAKFVGEIHEKVFFQGPQAQLSGWLYHYSYRDLSDYFARFNRYTSAVAANHFAAGKSANFLALVIRPWVEFIERYFLRLGFLDGYPGYCYALCSSLYAFTKYAKLKELRETDRSC